MEFSSLDRVCIACSAVKTRERQCCRPFAQFVVECYLFVLPSYQFLSQLFRKLVQSPQSPTFIRKFLHKFLCSMTFKNVQIFYQNSIFVAEIHVLRGELTIETQCTVERRRWIVLAHSIETKDISPFDCIVVWS